MDGLGRIGEEWGGVGRSGAVVLAWIGVVVLDWLGAVVMEWVMCDV